MIKTMKQEFFIRKFGERTRRNVRNWLRILLNNGGLLSALPLSFMMSLKEQKEEKQIEEAINKRNAVIATMAEPAIKEAAQVIDALAAQLQETPSFYITDIAGLNAEQTSKLRRACFEKQIKLLVVKNTLFRKALERNENEEIKSLYPLLAGPSAIMFCNTPNAPAKLIKEISQDLGKPELKGAYVQECAYIGAETLPVLIDIKSREELIGDIVALLQSPARNVISALQSAGGKLAGIVKTLSERE